MSNAFDVDEMKLRFELEALDKMRHGGSEGCNPRDILLLGQNDPLIQTAMTLWKRGHFSFEQALCRIITMQQERYQSLFAQLLDLHHKTRPPICIEKHGCTQLMDEDS